MGTKDTTNPADAPETTTAGEQAAPTASGKDLVSYRVTKKGDGKIFTGTHSGETGMPETFARGDIVPNVPRRIAEELEDRGFAEIEE